MEKKSKKISNGVKILKFGAVWCPECLVMRSMWEKIEKEMPELLTEYFDADENPEKLKEYGAKDIPVFIFLDKNNKEILRLTGMQNKDKLREVVRDNWDS